MESSQDQNIEKEMPAWIRISAGLFIGAVTLLCLPGSVMTLIKPPKNNPILGIVLGIILVFGCLWALEKSIRLLTGVRKR